jgi:type 1 glutamine amidotransferase
MGGGWTWGRSHHPPYGPIEVRLTEAGQQISDGPAEFELIDEAYHQLAPKADCIVLANCDLGQGSQPLAWVRQYGSGKVAVDALGHDVRSIEQEGHRAMIAGQLNWLRDEHA